MPTYTDTRFAGMITTEPGVIDEITPVVIVNAQGMQIDLFPDEAVRLAVKLIEAAARSERAEESPWLAS